MTVRGPLGLELAESREQIAELGELVVRVVRDEVTGVAFTGKDGELVVPQAGDPIATTEKVRLLVHARELERLDVYTAAAGEPPKYAATFVRPRPVTCIVCGRARVEPIVIKPPDLMDRIRELVDDPTAQPFACTNPECRRFVVIGVQMVCTTSGEKSE